MKVLTRGYRSTGTQADVTPVGLTRVSLGSRATYLRAASEILDMADPTAAPPLPSLLGVTVRRTMVVGRVSLTIGCLGTAFYSAAFGLAGSLFVSLGTVVLPVFAVSGGLGGIMVFSNDRSKGVLEYLVAYGLSPRRILLNVLVAGLVQVTIVLAVGVSAGVTAYLLSGHALNLALPRALLAYTFPMSYATVSLMTTVGVFWTSLSSPRAGMNSPLGVLPMIGVMPTAVTLVIALAIPSHATQIVLGAELIVVLVVVSLLARTDRLMPPDRLLSPA